MSIGSAHTARNDTQRRLYSLAEAFYEAKFERFPMTASELGRHEFDGEMGLPDEDTWREEERAVAAMQAAVEDLPEHEFDGDSWLDRRCLTAQLRTERMHLSALRTWRRNPNRYASGAIDGLLQLVIRHADRLDAVAEPLENRLRQVPDYLEAAESVLRRPVPLWAELAVKTCAGVDGFLDSLLAPLVTAGKSPPERIARRIQEAKRAFARYAKAVGRMRTGPEDGYNIGRKRFEMLIRERLGLPLSAREAAAMGRSLADSLGRELAEETAKFGPGRSAAEVLEEARAAWAPAGGDLIAAYRATTDRMRERFAGADAVGFPPGESLLVKAVPDFLAHEIPTAAYLQPGPFDKDQVGIFWVNDPTRSESDPDQRRREVSQHFGMELTCAHEAYPGHHLQFCSANLHRNELRRLFAHAVYYEGWTLWVEQMCTDLSLIDSPYAKLQQLHDALWRANRIIIDCGLHTGELDHGGAAAMLQENLGFTKARATAELNWYSQSPSVPMSYLIGKVENLRLKRKYVDGAGWSLRKFNDWLLSWGTVPQRWIEHAAGLGG